MSHACLLVADLRIVCEDQSAVVGRVNRVIALQLANFIGKHLVAMPWTVWQTLTEKQYHVSRSARSSQRDFEGTGGRNIYRNRHCTARSLRCQAECVGL